jgi:chromosome segregation protein
MQDVIFAGAPGRQASRSAEVELVLDDGDGGLGLGPEVSIVRRLDRAGEGEYRLAGARCRLVDVIELLSDTGLGKEMHSIISQGRVESIITSKPKDRRLLIEEAAGLGKHRKRRRRAQLKLERTQENLDRALDVEREARTRLRPLKRQAEAAELHARLERQSLQARWELARDELRSQLEVLELAESRAAAARTRREQVERELREVAARREAAEEALASRSAQREELSRRSFAAQSAGDRVSYRVEVIRAAAESVRTRMARCEQQLDSMTAMTFEDAVDPQAAQRIAALRAELEALERDAERTRKRALEELEGQHAQAQERVAGQDRIVEAALGERERAAGHAEEARAAVDQAQRELDRARLQAARVGGELAAVNQFLRSHAGSPGGVPLLCDQLEVDSGYELSVAAALDGRLTAALVSDRGAAEDVLNRAGPEGGRALMADGRGEVDSTSDAAFGVPPVAEAQPLAEHVRGSGHAAELVRSLLRGVWMVSSLERLAPGFRGTAVTPQGRVLSTVTAELRQAPAVGEERVLSQRNLRERLIGQTEEAAQFERRAIAQLARATAEHESARSRLEQATCTHRETAAARDEAAEQERRLGAVIERRRFAPEEGLGEERRRALAAELRAEEHAVARAAGEREQRRAHIERLSDVHAAGEALLPEIDGLLGALRAVGEAIEAQRARFEQALAEDRQTGEQVAADLRACAQEEAALQGQLHQVGEQLTEGEVTLHRARDRTQEQQQELVQLAGRLGLEPTASAEELCEEDRQTLQSRLERLARRREQLGPVNPLAGQEYADAVAHVEELEHQRGDLENALHELAKLIGDTDRQIRETFEETFQAAAANFEQVAGQLFPGGRARLRLVAQRDGPSSVLGGQVPEDANAEDQTEDEAPTGQPEEDLLGVEIEINPAGKEMKRLSLLSGGEKALTALAFLFAVFLARPCPFYILDEVEAALDDLNIDRFLALLRAYSGRAQFIVVTHQRRTMEAAEFLYGVSMGGDGVSKVISRRLPSEASAEAGSSSEAAAEPPAEPGSPEALPAEPAVA